MRFFREFFFETGAEFIHRMMTEQSLGVDDIKHFFTYCHGVVKKLKNGERKTFSFEKEEMFEDVQVKVIMTKSLNICKFCCFFEKNFF
jgi:hypothetical protein